MLRLNTHVVIFERILVISQVLDDSVHLLGLCLADVGAFALLNFVLQVDDVFISISDCLLFHLNLGFEGSRHSIEIEDLITQVLDFANDCLVLLVD